LEDVLKLSFKKLYVRVLARLMAEQIAEDIFNKGQK